MTTANQVAGRPASASSESKRYNIPRDNDRPLAFLGVQLAEACIESRSATLNTIVICAAMYRTEGGKHIATLTKRITDHVASASAFLEQMVNGESESRPAGEYSKASVKDTFEEALSWFRPGRVTDALREKLGLDKPEWVD